jgi:hypothetical protein
VINRVRFLQVRLADNLDDQANSAQIALAIPSSITEEDYQRFFLSRLRQVIFGDEPGVHWYTDFEGAGILSLRDLSLRKYKVGIRLIGGLVNNRKFTTPDVFIHDPTNTGTTIEVFHCGRRMLQSLTGDVREGDYYVSESGGPGTGFDTINLLSFTPGSRSVLVSNYSTTS